MKKVLGKIIAGAVVAAVLIVPGVAFAAQGVGVGTGARNGQPAWEESACAACNSAVIDADGDGICDNCAAADDGGCAACGFAYVDADDDGVCDNREACKAAANGQNDGSGQGNCYGQGNGCSAGENCVAGDGGQRCQMGAGCGKRLRLQNRDNSGCGSSTD